MGQAILTGQIELMAQFFKLFRFVRLSRFVRRTHWSYCTDLKSEWTRFRLGRSGQFGQIWQIDQGGPNWSNSTNRAAWFDEVQCADCAGLTARSGSTDCSDWTD